MSYTYLRRRKERRNSNETQGRLTPKMADWPNGLGTLFTKIKLGLFRNIPPSKRWLVPSIQERLMLSSAAKRRESGVTRNGRRNKYLPHEGLRERLRHFNRLHQMHIRAELWA